MIKNIRVKNFVHFYEEQTLSFEKEGPYFFVGGNGSGKSCMLEAIRRCMSSSKNMGLSSSHKPTEDAVVVCEFELPGDNTAISGVVYIGSTNKPRNNGHDAFVKFVCVKTQQQSDKENRYDLYVDLLKKIAKKWAVNEEIVMDQDAKREFGECLFGKELEKISECVKKNIVDNEKFETFSQKEGLKYNESTKCEKFLREEIDERVGIAFPGHGVSPVQWTMSKTFQREPGNAQDYRQTANDQIKERSQIVSWYLGLTNGDVSDEERERVDLYFEKITNNDQLRFKKIESEIEVEDHGEQMRLDQCPGGYFEAMNWAIMLAMNKFKTVCLDDIGKCMHQQMIERMRDEVLRKIKDKVVIATTHIPTFFSCDTIRKAFIFRRQVIAKEGPKFAVISSESILLEVDKSQPIFQTRDYSTLFFAKRVMFVEGNSDLKVLSALQCTLLQDETLMKSIVNMFGQNSAVHQFYHFLSSLHLISLHGHMNKLKFHQVCKKLKLEHFLLLDRNAVIEKGSAEGFLKDFNIDDIDKDECVSCLEGKSIFVWKSGNIEDALATLGSGVKQFLDPKEDDQQTNAAQVTEKAKMAKKRDPSNMKLFSRDSKLNDENLMEFARVILDGCLLIDDKGADFCRLLRFLLKYANHQHMTKQC